MSDQADPINTSAEKSIGKSILDGVANKFAEEVYAISTGNLKNLELAPAALVGTGLALLTQGALRYGGNIGKFSVGAIGMASLAQGAYDLSEALPKYMDAMHTINNPNSSTSESSKAHKAFEDLGGSALKFMAGSAGFGLGALAGKSFINSSYGRSMEDSLIRHKMAKALADHDPKPKESWLPKGMSADNYKSIPADSAELLGMKRDAATRMEAQFAKANKDGLVIPVEKERFAVHVRKGNPGEKALTSETMNSGGQDVSNLYVLTRLDAKGKPQLNPQGQADIWTNDVKMLQKRYTDKTGNIGIPKDIIEGKTDGIIWSQPGRADATPIRQSINDYQTIWNHDLASKEAGKGFIMRYGTNKETGIADFNLADLGKGSSSMLPIGYRPYIEAAKIKALPLAAGAATAPMTLDMIKNVTR